MQLIAITSEKFLVGESEAINALFANGLERLHLRKPGATLLQTEQLIREIDARWYSRISLHDHFGLAKKYGIGGLHLNSRNPQPPTGFAGILSRSCHSMEEAAREKHKYDYVFLSPIFDSISKNGYTAAFHRGALQAAARNGSIGDNVIALGGITPERIEEAAACNFGGAAVLGYLWADSVEETLERFRALETAARRQPPRSGGAPRTVLTIAGSDCSGGAGIQADIKTVTLHGCYAATAITSITVQNTLGVKSSHPVNAKTVTGQINAVMEDMCPAAIKIGMVCNKEIAAAIASCLKNHHARNVVFDPVMVATSGLELMDSESIETVIKELMPVCSLITPNIPEAGIISGNSAITIENIKDTCMRIYGKTGTSVLIKGGHSENNKAIDTLFYGGRFYEFANDKIASGNLHGTGCVLSSAIACNLANGLHMPEAVAKAKEFLTAAMHRSSAIKIGHGNGACLII